MRNNIPEADEILDLYFPVLDGNGFVALVDYMGGDNAIEKYARVSYGNKTRKVSDTNSLIRYLIRNHHSSPVESTELAFHIGLPIHVARQLIRHRTFSPVNEFSGRYSVMPDLFYTPSREVFAKQSDDNKQGRSDQCLELEEYDGFMKEVHELRNTSKTLYHKMLDSGIAREVARMDLPLSTYTYWYCKMDLSNLFKMLKLRLHFHAQHEIRQYAFIMAGMAQRVAPLAFQAWVDYVYGADTMTKLDKDFLNWLIATYKTASIQDLKNLYECEVHAELKDFHKTFGMSTKRELPEFWDKLNPITVPDFSLNLDAVKNAGHFEEIILANC